MSQWTNPCNEEEQALREDFDAHFQRLAAESGRALAGYVREQAWTQVLLYARRLRTFADGVSETEVRLLLPDRQSPGSRSFAIEGVVDVVEANGSRKMYDIKTHTPVEGLEDERVTRNIQQQLTLYASLWQNLRGEPLDGIGIIATKPSAAVDAALQRGSRADIEKAVRDWSPVKELALNTASIDETIRRFGCVVDAIESGEFPPRDAEDLSKKDPGGRQNFGVDTCRNCGGRFGCSSYRSYQGQLAAKPTARRSGEKAPVIPAVFTDPEIDLWEELDARGLANSEFDE
jgi:hypothetical protein